MKKIVFDIVLLANFIYYIDILRMYKLSFYNEKKVKLDNLNLS
jgi:hypothetical protein